MIWVGTALLTSVAAFLYRVGGMSKGEAKSVFPWLPSVFVRSICRDVGVSLATVAWLVLFLSPVAAWALAVAFCLSWAALTTYWDEVFKKDCFFAHGLGIGLALLPIAITGSAGWVGYGVRALVLATLMWAVSAASKNVFVEEYGRGAAVILTLPLLLL